MSGYEIQYKRDFDGWTYCWDKRNKLWVAVRPVTSLPDDIKQRVLKDKQQSEEFSEVVVP